MLFLEQRTFIRFAGLYVDEHVGMLQIVLDLPFQQVAYLVGLVDAYVLLDRKSVV